MGEELEMITVEDPELPWKIFPKEVRNETRGIMTLR